MFAKGVPGGGGEGVDVVGGVFGVEDVAARLGCFLSHGRVSKVTGFQVYWAYLQTIKYCAIKKWHRIYRI